MRAQKRYTVYRGTKPAYIVNKEHQETVINLVLTVTLMILVVILIQFI